MGAYYYLLSGQTKNIWIGGKPTPINLIKISDDVGVRWTTPAIKATLSRNENYWSKRPRPKYMTYDFAQYEVSHIYHWRSDLWTHFSDTVFFVDAGRIQIKNRRMIASLYHTMVARVDDKYSNILDNLNAFESAVPGASAQTSGRVFNQENITFVYLHAPDLAGAVMAKMFFPNAVPFTGALDQYHKHF